jgi:mutator protein MutT
MHREPTPLTSNGAPSTKWVDVAVAAIYRRVDGRVELLVARRHDHAIRGGLWEFPGGKIERGEHPSEAAIREAREEVGFAEEEFVSQPAPLVVVEHSDPELARERSVRLHAFLAEVKPNAVPQALGASEVRWIGVEQISEFEWPKANASINTAIASALG